MAREGSEVWGADGGVEEKEEASCFTAPLLPSLLVFSGEGGRMGEEAPAARTQPGYSCIIGKKQSLQASRTGWKSIPPLCWEAEQREGLCGCAVSG